MYITHKSSEGTEENASYDRCDNLECCEVGYCICEKEAPEPSKIDILDYLNDYGWQAASETIWNMNDADKTTWEDVKGWFTKAASRAKQRKY